jgi:thiol peroxidase
MEPKELFPQPISIRGERAYTFARPPLPGTAIPDFFLPDGAFRDRSRADFLGRPFVLAAFPTLETETGAQELAALGALAAETGCPVAAVTNDTPFALRRFAAPEGVTLLSAFRSPEFGMDFGCLVVEHQAMGILARLALAVDAEGKVLAGGLSPELSDLPDLAPLAAALRAAT